MDDEERNIEIHEEEAHDFDPDKDSFDLDDISMDSDEEDDCGNKCVEILSELLASQYKINEKLNSEAVTNLESSIIICEHHKNLFESINKNYNRHSQSNIISSNITLLPNHKNSKELPCDQFFEESFITSLDQQIILYDNNIPITNNKYIGNDKRNSIIEKEDKIINQENCEYQQSLYDNNMTSQQQLSSIQLCNNFSNINNINTCNKPITSNNGGITSIDQVKVRNKEGPQVPPKPKIDSVRLSMAAVKDSSDWELDALLNELTHLEDQLNSSTGTDQLILGIPTLLPSTKIKKDTTIPAINEVSKEVSPKIYRGNDFSRQNINCPSPDVDSAFGDTSTDCGSNFTRATTSDFSSNDSCRGSLNTPSPTQQELMAKTGAITPPASVVSSCSSSSGVSSTSSSNTKQSLYPNNLSSPAKDHSSLTPAQLKAEKIREALEKMKEANIKKVYVKFFLEDNHTISLLIDERWSCVEVMKVIVSKLGISLHPEHCIIEEYPQLRIKRIYEDHESVVENILMWTQDSPNKLYFKRQQDKFAFILKPQIFLINERTKEYLPSPQINLTAAEREKVLKLFFQPDSTLPPEIDGYLYLKQDGKKSWKRHYFVLRSSGLYYSIKGKSKAPKDLQCIMNFHSNQIYTCTDWKKKYKAPTGYGFAIKPPQIQVKNSKYIKYICAESEILYMQWICALRIAKNGFELYKAYEDSMRRMVTSQCHTPIKVDTPSISSRINSPMPLMSHGGNIFEMGNQNMNDNCKSISTASSKASNSEQVSMTSMCFDQDDCGTIKRSPVDITTPILNIKNNQQGLINCNNLRDDVVTEEMYRNSCISENSSRQLFVDDNRSGVVTPSIEVPSEDFDSDEEPLPPPPMSATFVGGNEQQKQCQSFTPTSFTSNGTPLKSALKKTPPPPPPKRSNTTRLQMTHDSPQNVSSFHNELQNAMNRRLNIMERS
uniref:PH domain-containing protein n=1 Tax=Strongyloides stercoralis TaxID=6248 RepID=A0A0K0DSL8_STRER